MNENVSKDDFFNNMREDFLNKGATIVEYELEEQVNEVVEVRKEYPLKNTELLSVEIITKELPKQIKDKVREHQSNLRRIIYATAQYIEENRFNDINEELKNVDLSKIERSKVEGLINSQKKINYSFQTLNAGMEIFSIVNKTVLEKIKNNDFENTKDGKIQKNTNYLANAILVFELTNFIIEHIKGFSLVGIDEIKEIEKNIMKDLEKNEANDNKLEEKTNNSDNQDMKDNILMSIQGRKETRKVIREKWDNFMRRMTDLDDGISKSLKMTSELELIRDNAKNQLDILQVIATVQVLEKNLEIFEGLSFMKKIELAPLNADEAKDLLGLS